MRKLLGALIGSAVIVSGCVIALTSSSTAEGDGANAASGVVMPFNSVYGLGMSGESMDRDDQVAAYEAWKRELDVRDCMRSRGHAYAAGVAYPAAALERLDVQKPSGLSVKDAGAVNRAHIASMARAAKDDYYRDLWGESLASIENAEETGEVPQGRSPESFAVGGCKGQARNTPSVWDLKRKYSDRFLEMRAEVRAGSAMDAARADFRVCAEGLGVSGISSLPELEPAVMDGKIDGKQMNAVSGACSDAWMAAEREALAEAQQTFIEQHAGEVEASNDRGREMMSASKRDQGFADAIGAAIGDEK